MARRIRKFRSFRRNNQKTDYFIIALAFLSAFATTFSFYILLISFGIVPDKNPTQTIHGVAVERAIDEAGDSDSEKDVSIELLNNSASYASKGEENVRFFAFNLSSPFEARIKELIFSLSGYAKPSDVVNLQLFVNGKFIGEKSFFEGKGSFSDLNIQIDAGHTMEVEVTGKVSDEATTGDGVQVGIHSSDDLIIKTPYSKVLTVDAEFPLFGNPVSVIGDQLN